MKKIILCIAAMMSLCSGVFAQQGRHNEIKAVLIPIREAVLASRADGIITKLNVKFGDRFNKDDIIAQIDDTRCKIEIERIESLIKESEVQKKFADENLKNQKEIGEMASKFDLRKAELEVETTAARLSSLKSGKKEAELQLEYCTMRAPFSGRVEEILTREFEAVRSAQPLLRVIDDNQLLAVMNIPVSSLGKAGKDTKLKLKLGPEEIEREGVVSEISPRADHRSDTIEIRALVDNADKKLTAGMTGVLVNVEPK